MDQRDLERELEFEQALAESERLLMEAARSDYADAEADLESILAEFGSSPSAAPLASSPAPSAEDAAGDGTPAAEAESAEESPAAEEQSAPAVEDDDLNMFVPQAVNLQTVMEQTVSSVLDEDGAPVLLDPPKRRGLFSRRPLQDTEELYRTPKEADDEPEEEAEPIDEDFESPDGEEEEPFAVSSQEYRELAKHQTKAFRIASVVTALMWIPVLLSYFGLMPAMYEQDRLLNCLPYMVGELLVCLLAREVFIYGFEQLFDGKVTFELLAALGAIAALGDTVLEFFLPLRTALPGIVPFHAAAALGLTFALRGRSLLFDAMHNTFRVTTVGDPSYLVTITAGGAAKRRGEPNGFSRCAQRDDLASHWQALLLPIILAATFVFAVLSTVHTGSYQLFLWNWSALLIAANTLAFPLVYALPLRRLSRRFVKSGAALGGYAGADRLRRSNCMILTDSDLFPPGTISFNGLKIYGEESGKVFSYAATMAHAAGCGYSGLFDSLLENQQSEYEPLDDLDFYEEGGVSGTIRGEFVLFGTASFMRRMGVILPNGLNLKTGVFLAVDKTLVAVFAVKYLAAENVDWALHSLRRNRITPVLAVRDSNITPQLLKRKFGTDAKAVYPKIATRLALSEKEGVKPCALLYREGLMPYAEVTIGSKRLVHAVRRGNTVSLLASILSALLAFYLTYVGSYTTLTLPSMALYLLLWMLAAIIDGLFVDRY